MPFPLTPAPAWYTAVTWATRDGLFYADTINPPGPPAAPPVLPNLISGPTPDQGLGPDSGATGFLEY